MFKLKSIKTQLIIYLVCFAAFLSLKNKDTAFLFAAIISVLSSVLFEAVILLIRTKTFKITESSVITGLIISFVLSGDNSWFKIAAASAIAILSKALLRFRKKHIFNPAGFGIFLVTVLFGATTDWKGTYAWYVVVPLGFYFVSRIKKMEIIIGYFSASFVLFGAQALLQKVSLLNIFGYFSYFYIFVMAIEPLTTPVKPIGKFLFGMMIASFIFVLTQVGARFDVELCSLLVLNMTVPWLNKIGYKKGEKL